MKRKKTKLITAIFVLIPLIIAFNGDVNAFVSWTRMNSLPAEGFFDIWGSSGSDVFSVGRFGTMVHYDGNAEYTWSEWEEIQGH